ncbi:MAG TPA: hypothetical protein VIJ14_05240, partial [Rhabdochlamydiaceae bacterium]
AKTACEIGSAFSYTADFSQKAIKRIKLAVGPSDFSSLALDTLNLARSLNVPKLDTAEISKIALSVLKRSCDMLRWLERHSFIALESTLLGRLEGVAILSDLTSASVRLWQDLGPTPPADRDLLLSISKVLGASLLLYAYVADDKRVKVVTTGIGIMGDGYCLYYRCCTMDPRSWTITREQVCQIISSIALASLAFYALEKGFCSESNC